MKIFNHKKLQVLALMASGALGVGSAAQATDLGTQAKVWDITEQDMREIVLTEAARVDWAQKNKELRENAQSYTDNLPKRALPEADKTETAYIDPSIQLSSDIKIPVKGPDGKYTWQVHYAKGMSLNPLAKVRPVTALLFFDARSPEQVAFAKELVSDPLSRIVPLEVSGDNFQEVVKDFGRAVFYAFDAQLARFNVTKLPALVYPGSGKYSLYLANTVFAKPYRAASVAAVWPSTFGVQTK